MTKRILLVLLASLFAVTALAKPVVLPTNKDGSIITGVLTAAFDPLDQEGAGPVIPFPFNMLYLNLETLSPTGDYTLVIPVDDPEDFGDPSVALSAMDGFSTTEKWVTSFVDYPTRSAGSIDPSSVIPGHSVRVFQVDVTQFLFVNGVVRELVPGVDFVAVVAPGGNIAIIPLKPLQELTNYMAVLTNDIRDTDGNNATADSTYHLLKRQTPWVDENGKSTYLIADELAQTLEKFRPLVNSWEAAAESQGVVREDIILSWPVQTQSTTWVLKQLRGIAKPAPTVVGPTGMTTKVIGGFGLADVYAGIITIPYYLGVPSAENPVAPLTDFWTAEPGAYVPPFDALLADKTSTHVTVANPFPVVTSMQTVPLLMAVPNESSGKTRPAAGWPVVIYAHGITRNRADMLAVADTAARAGYAVIAIDAPMHGVSPDDPLLGPLHAKKGPFKDFANERTFDVDYINNATGAPGPDEIADPSGTHFINLGSMLTTRDNLRQGETDLSILAVTIPSISYDGDALPDLDGSTIQFVGQSMGSIMGTAFAAIEPTVTNAFLSVPAGGLARALEYSEAFGPRIRAGLEAAAGLVPGTADYEQYFLVFQTVIDSADPINWSAEAARYNNIVLHEVIGDTVLPNYVPTAPLSGTEPMIRAMGLTSYSTTQHNPAGLDIAGRFVPPANHGSLLDPKGAPEATAEMQGQMAAFLATLGTTVVVDNESTMVPVVQVDLKQPVSDMKETSNSKKAKKGSAVKKPIKSGTVQKLNKQPLAGELR